MHAAAYRAVLCYSARTMKRNTIYNGSVRYVIFREGATWYGAALEFNIVESGDDPREVLLLLLEAIGGYVAAARAAKARPGVLNQTPTAEYETLWQIGQGIKKRPVRSPIRIYTAGVSDLRTA